MTISVVQNASILGETGGYTASLGVGNGWNTPVSGNIIVVFFAVTQLTTLTPPTGFTQSYLFSDFNDLYGVWYKVSDGTETSITFDWTQFNTFWGLQAVELSGQGATPIAGTNANKVDPASTSTLTALTPDNTTDAMYLAFNLFEDDDCSAFTYTNGLTIGQYNEVSGFGGRSVGFGHLSVTDGSSLGTTIGKIGGSSDGYVSIGVMVNGSTIPGAVNAKTASLNITTHAATIESGAASTNDFRVQRYSGVLFGASEDTWDITLDNTVVTANTILRMSNTSKQGSGRNGSSANLLANEIGMTCEFVNGDTVRLTREATGADFDQIWQIELIEYVGPVSGDNEFIVRQQGNISLAAASLSNTVTISGIVNIDDCVPFLTSQRTSETTSQVGEGIHMLEFTDASTLEASRSVGSNDSTAGYSVVEFTGANWTIGHRRSTQILEGNNNWAFYDEQLSNTTAQTLNDTAESFVEYSHVSDATDNGLSSMSVAVGLTSTTNVMVSTAIMTPNPIASFVGNIHIISNPTLSVQHSNPTDPGAADADFNVGITAVNDVTTTSLHCSVNTSGDGTAHARYQRGIWLTDASTVRWWGHRTGNNLYLSQQVVEWLGTSSASGGTDTDVNATTDALTLTEYPATISFDVNVNANTAALVLTEYGATIEIVANNVNVNANTNNLTLTEYPASISFDVNVNANTDALAITTYSATIDVVNDVYVNANTYGLTIVTHSATVSLDATDVNVNATTDALTLTEYPASISFDVNVNANTDVLSITEYPANINVEVSYDDTAIIVTVGLF